MKNIIVPSSQHLEFYLQQEELLTSICVEPSFFTWIVQPTVIYGQHQVREMEINLDYCKKNNVRIVQRKSGGGCVYADEGNLMISFIIPSTHSKHVFSIMINLLASILAKMDYPAVTTDHNDILVNGGKVSGSACYIVNNHTIVHSTMLYNTNFDVLQQVLTPSQEKLEKHAVQSVRQRVVNLIDNKNWGDIYQFKTKLEKELLICTPNF